MLLQLRRATTILAPERLTLLIWTGTTKGSRPLPDFVEAHAEGNSTTVVAKVAGLSRQSVDRIIRRR